MRLSPFVPSLVACIIASLSSSTSGLVHPQKARGDLNVRCLKQSDSKCFTSGSIRRHPSFPSSSSELFALPSGKRFWPKNAGNNPIIQAVRRFSQQLVSFPARFRIRFSKLSKRGKQLFLIQVFCITMIFCSLGRTAYIKYNYNDSRVPSRVPVEVPYSKFMDLVEKSGSEHRQGSVVVDNIRIGSDRISYRLTKQIDGVPTPSSKSSAATASASATSPSTAQIMAYTRKVPASPELIQFFRDNDTPFSAAPIPRTNSLAVVARSAIVAFYLLILFRMYKTFTGQMGGGSGSNSDTPGKLASTIGNLPLASFLDIQGIDDAKLEVMELVDTLRNPEKYAILGARAPTGLLLEGPPGTGKTMLARATAAAAGVPLIYCSGSDFVEMFVGRGAARVRKLFERATKLSPCIIFVDELDALGKARDSPSNFMRRGGNDEAEQTLNQLLACMDGLDSTRRICVLGATNRKEVLDPALIRPGRFDRIVTLKLPDAAGRENILRVHASKLPGFKECVGVDNEPGSLGKGNAVDLSAVAAVTRGLSGAELEFIVNESAIRAVRRVSAAISKGEANITPSVLPSDFVASVQNFNDTRRPNKDGVGDLLKNVWKQ